MQSCSALLELSNCASDLRSKHSRFVDFRLNEMGGGGRVPVLRFETDVDAISSLASQVEETCEDTASHFIERHMVLVCGIGDLWLRNFGY